MKTKYMGGLVIVFLVALLVMPSSTLATSYFYGIDEDENEIYRFDLTGSRTLVFDFDDQIEVESNVEIENLTWAGGNTYYAADGNDEYDTADVYRFQLNGTVMSNFEQVGVINNPDSSSNHEIDSLQWVNGLLYTMDTNKGTFMAIDPLSASSPNDVLDVDKWVDIDDPDHIEGLAYHDDKLYASDTNSSSKLYTINFDIQSSDFGKVSPLVMDLVDADVEALLSLDGKLYGASRPGDYFFEIDLASTTTTDLFPLNGLDIEGLAPAANPVPEPATMLMVGAGLIGLAGLRRKIGKKA